MNNMIVRAKKISLILLCSFFCNVLSAASGSLTVAKGKVISYSDIGNGSPIILIHSFPADQQLWQPQHVLSKKFRIITLDLCGFGKSSKTNGSAVTMANYANAVKQLMDHLHIKNAVIGGESMGGYVALQLLEAYPDKVGGLILSNTQAIADSYEAKLKRETSAKDVLQHGTSKLINDVMQKELSSHTSDTTKQFLRNIFEKQAATGIASALRGMAIRNDTSHVLENTTIPVLIITSDLDTLLPPEQSKKMHQLAKNSKLIIIKNAGHLSSLEQPEQWNKAVSVFVSEVFSPQ